MTLRVYGVKNVSHIGSGDFVTENGSMASCSLGQGRQQRKYTVIQVLEQLEADDSDFGAESDSDSYSDESFQPHESEGGESSAQDSDLPNDSSSDEDLQITETASPQLDPNCATKTYRWRKKVFELPDVSFQGQQVESYQDATTDTPLVYFRRFVSLDMLENIVEHTNQHSVQKHRNCVNTSVKEIEQVLGMYLRMGLVQMSGVRQYWESEVRYGPVADIMSRNRFNQLLSVIHFVDNEMANEEVKMDRLWKLRPFLDSFRRQLWARCCVTGLLHDFDIYQGKGGGNGQKGPKKSQLGVGGDIVVKLCESLADKVNFLIFADNFFASMPLIEKLLAKGIYYTGTVRENRMSKWNLIPDKDLSKKGRGSYDYQLESNTNTVCLKWQDTKAVSLMSTYAGPEPLRKARRWDKSKKEYTYIDQPNIIKEYNASMGGVDMLDAHLARCKFPIRTRRWYMIIFWHFMSVAVINAWLLYQRDCEAQGITGSKVLKLRKFQGLVAQGLAEVGTPRKRGRPSTPRSSSPSSPPPPRFVRVYQSADVRFDQIGHWPVKEENRRRCAVCKDLKTEMHSGRMALPSSISRNRRQVVVWGNSQTRNQADCRLDKEKRKNF
ncbi:piggyBac transposable element-derived protein 2-like [Corythoichthys intestinalis]|uniref:piggyBac transposable element-derived protein 2-like n=1 Tax=Corythoichthys intestinalis TaxID=161448 RepID=UPI0025A5DABA|nr:piggyBac transposable element-derived protein 2-like [Corythoichthys intestinalis]